MRFKTAKGGDGFAGIEVKYHEGLNDAEAKERPRHDEDGVFL